MSAGHRVTKHLAPRWVVAVLVAACVLGMVASFLNGASAGSAPFVVEGSQVSDERFSFSTLQPRGVRVQIDSIRAQRADDCMAARGFTEPPVDAPVEAEEVRYAAAFGDAIIGDDATSDDAPAPTPVRMPDGSTFAVTATWRPDTCAYQAAEALGGDPFLREALRQQVMVYEAQAGEEIEQELSDEVAEWSRCVGNEQLTAADLLREVDDRRLRTDLTATADGTCLTDDIEETAVQKRADAELPIANEHRLVVEAWIQVLEREATAAGL